MPQSAIANSISAGVDCATGRITLILGCMFSGKTTFLLQRLSERDANDVALFKSRIDARYGSGIVSTHNRKSRPAKAIDEPAEILQAPVSSLRLIGLDEAHFFGCELVEVLKRVQQLGVDVILTGLDRDSWGRPFPVIERLRAVAQTVREFTALCGRCGAIADRTQRLTRITDRSMVGGPESYEPRCSSCWEPPQEPPM